MRRLREQEEYFFSDVDLSKIGEVYYDPEQGYCGINELQRKTRMPQKDIVDFLHRQDVYTKHKPLTHRFKRRRVYVTHIDDQWQVDLIDMQKFKAQNDNMNYILSVIDIFSKYAWAVPIRRKTGEEVTDAFIKIFERRVPEKIQSDKGLEFINKKTQKLFKKLDIHWFTTENVEIKCSVIERWNRTLKTKMWKYFTANDTRKWIDVLDPLVYNYNHSYHRSIQMTPVEASDEDNEGQVYRNLFKEKVVPNPKFKIGDHVRISIYKKPFRKGYLPTFTDEMFEVSGVLQTDPVTYRLKDLGGEEVIGTFYEKEMVRYDNDVFKIEKILRRKGDKLLVKWLNYPDKFNSWVDAKDIL